MGIIIIPNYAPCPRRFEDRADNAVHEVQLFGGAPYTSIV